MEKTFAILGAAGYIAPRHMHAIKEVGGKLVAAFDPHDSVGVLDKYDLETRFFSDKVDFWSYICNAPPDFMVICTPNFLHHPHCHKAMVYGSNVICEKPIAINPFYLNGLQDVSTNTGKNIYTVMQMRYHPDLMRLYHQMSGNHDRHTVSLVYTSPRGNWYHNSWKGDDQTSGGLAVNIGVHMFDLLTWIFGNPQEVMVRERSKDTISGELKLEKADVYFMLSIHPSYNQKRRLNVDSRPIQFTDGVDKLHTRVYQDILNGHGLGINDARASISLAHTIQNVKENDVVLLSQVVNN